MHIGLKKRAKQKMATSTFPNSVAHTRHLLYLYGTVTQLELRGFLEANSIDTEERQQQIRNEWRAAAEGFAEITAREHGEPESIETEEVRDDNGQVSRLIEDPAFAAIFPNYPVSVENVEIDKIVASQRTVHLEYVQRVRTLVEDSRPDLFAFCVTPRQEATPINIMRSGQSAFTLSSDNPGLRFLGVYDRNFADELIAPQHAAGQARKAVVLIFGYGTSTVNAFRVGRRIILNNGFHTLYALRAAGITRAPMVVQAITHPQLELPPRIADLPREYLVESPRPALMKDFFVDQLTCEVTQRSFLKAIQIGWGANESLVPR